MTIITKPITEKKLSEKVNILDGDVNINIEPTAPESTEDPDDILILRARLRRINSNASLCLLTSLMIILTMSVISGGYLYRQYSKQQLHNLKLWCRVPYDEADTDETLPISYSKFTGIPFSNSPISSYEYPENSNVLKSFNRNLDMMNNMIEKELSDDNKFFKEQFELDLDNESYEKIDVPDFQGGHKGRFVHDFNTNKTGIVDITKRRCFVMPLNRAAVLPPRSLFDLIMKMWDGYYDVDTEEIRETMRVVTPAMTDASEIGSYITRECAGMDVYKLERVNSTRVSKRSVDAAQFDFAVYSGKTAKYNIIGLEQLDEK